MNGSDRRQSDLFPWETVEPSESGAATEAGQSDPSAEQSASSAADPEPVPSGEARPMEQANDEPAPEREAHSETAPPADDEASDPALDAMAGLIERLEREVGLIPATGRDRPAIAAKEYYSISEVCDLVDLKPHVLRYWETQFHPLNPSKNRSGNRVYQRKEIKLILLVKHLLYEEKYTIEGAKTKLDRLRRGGGLNERTTFSLDSDLVALLRSDLDELMRILTPSESAG